MILRPCSHVEILIGPDATAADVATWAATLASEPCPRCAAPPPAPAAEPEPAPLPAEVRVLLLRDGRAGALAAQAGLDALGVGPELYPTIRDFLARRPGTSPYWRRWWDGWRNGALTAEPGA